MSDQPTLINNVIGIVDASFQIAELACAPPGAPPGSPTITVAGIVQKFTTSIVGLTETVATPKKILTAADIMCGTSSFIEMGNHSKKNLKFMFSKSLVEVRVPECQKFSTFVPSSKIQSFVNTNFQHETPQVLEVITAVIHFFGDLPLITKDCLPSLITPLGLTLLGISTFLSLETDVTAIFTKINSAKGHTN